MAKLAGSIWIEGSNLHYIDSTGYERYIIGQGPILISTAIPGSVWIDTVNNYLYYVDASNYRRYISIGGDLGTKTGSKNGSLWIEGNYVYYISNSIKYRAGHENHVDDNHDDHSDHDDRHLDGYRDTHIDDPNYHTDDPNYHNDTYTDDIQNIGY